MKNTTTGHLWFSRQSLTLVSMTKKSNPETNLQWCLMQMPLPGWTQLVKWKVLQTHLWVVTILWASRNPHRQQKWTMFWRLSCTKSTLQDFISKILFWKRKRKLMQIEAGVDQLVSKWHRWRYYTWAIQLLENLYAELKFLILKSFRSELSYGFLSYIRYVSVRFCRLAQSLWRSLRLGQQIDCQISFIHIIVS